MLAHAPIPNRGLHSSVNQWGGAMKSRGGGGYEIDWGGRAMKLIGGGYEIDSAEDYEIDGVGL